MAKKSTRRSKAQFPALDPKFNLKTRSDLIEIESSENLPESWTDPKTGKTWSGHELKQYVNDFNNEHVNADFKTNIKEGRKRIHKKKKVEHEKNKHLKKLILDFLNNMKKLILILNEAQITNNSRSKFKKSINKFKKQLKTQIKKEFKFIEDYYKRESEHSNNHRNMCILSRQKAAGQLKSLDVIPETIMNKKDMESESIDIIDKNKCVHNFKYVEVGKEKGNVCLKCRLVVLKDE